MKRIPLTQDRCALVDEEYFEGLSKFKWRAQKDFRTGRVYAVRSVGKVSVMMHRQIMGIDDDREVDHINGVGLDNRRSNLRYATKSQNHQNQKLRADTKTGFKGVSKYANRRDLWRARILVKGERIHLGCFKSPEEAAVAYDEAAKKFFGEFALINFGDAETAGGNW